MRAIVGFSFLVWIAFAGSRANAACTITDLAPTGVIQTASLGPRFSFVATHDCVTLDFLAERGAVSKAPLERGATPGANVRYEVTLSSGEWAALTGAVNATLTWSIVGTDDSGDRTRVTTTNELDLDADGWTRDVDCDDTEVAVNPGADETCDELDDDCDALIDDDDDSLVGGGRTWWYPDLDGDGLGTDVGRMQTCARPGRGYVTNRDDCDDADPTVGSASWYHPDDDGDGHGLSNSSSLSCTVPVGWTLTSDDCDDDDATVYPDAPDVCDAKDNDCDDLVDDEDPDFVGTTFYSDRDGDGHGNPKVTDASGCDATDGYVAYGNDCDDTDVLVHAGAPELCDRLDNDCDTSVDESVDYVDWYADGDADGFGVDADVTSDCDQPGGYAIFAGDCDDYDSSISPGVDEWCGNGVDDDCDGGVDNCAVSLVAVADATVSGPEENAYFGFTVDSVDVDGDGADDLLAGAPYAGSGLGRAFVAFGPMSGATRADDLTLALKGPRSYSELGTSFTGADANEDGSVDLLTGAPGSQVNSAFLFLGPMTASAPDPDATLHCSLGAVDAVGTDILIVPDHDGDGAPDLVIGAPSWDLKRGAVYVASGAVTGVLDLEADATYKYGGSFRSRVGTSLADLGDENGDGLEDLLFGAPNEGAAYVVDGGGPLGTLSVGTRAAVASLVGPRAYPDQFGVEVASADLDGDGYGDALVSAPFARNTRGDDAGAVYAFLGPFAGAIGTEDAAVRWEGIDGAGYFGWSVTSGGDVDADGEIDTLIGDPWDGGDTGATYLQLGQASGVVDARSLTSFVAPATDWVGSDAAFVRDWSGDGRPEIAIGSRAATTSDGERSGQVSVIFSESIFE